MHVSGVAVVVTFDGFGQEVLMALIPWCGVAENGFIVVRLSS